MAGQPPFPCVADRTLPHSSSLDVGLLGYLERVVNINSEIAHGAFELKMTE